MADAVSNVSNTLSTVNNVAFKTELALYRLHKAVSGDGYTTLLNGLKDPLKGMVTRIQEVLGQILTKVQDIIKPFLDEKVLVMFTDVLGAGRDLVEATLDLLPESAQKMAETSRRFLNVIVDFVGVGIFHIAAIIDLLMNVGLALAGKASTLAAKTLDMVKETESLLLPAPVTLKSLPTPAPKPA
ncbi:hypothetical protein ACN28I_11635 [Archangium gephyra]|uniref:hypothetical protein n=1 Tax=Archangium gephyra TaxID=48 RepID=UPI003B77510D